MSVPIPRYTSNLSQTEIFQTAAHAFFETFLRYSQTHIEKTGEKIVYFGDQPQFFVSDVMENDILCPYGEDGQKFILSDTFGCWDDGEYVGQVSKETIAKLPKAN